MPPIPRAEALNVNVKLAATSAASAAFQNVVCRRVGAPVSSVSTAGAPPAGAGTVGGVPDGSLVTTVATMTSPTVSAPGAGIESALAGAAVEAVFAPRNTIAPCAGAGDAAATPHAHAATIARTLTPA